MEISFIGFTNPDVSDSGLRTKKLNKEEVGSRISTLLIRYRNAKDGEKHPTLLRNKVGVQFIKNKDLITPYKTLKICRTS